MKPETLDRVKVITSEKEYEGMLMPEKKSDAFVTLKLDSGYNIGIEKEKIKEIKVIKKHEETEKHKKEKLTANKNLPNITILHTGGTIASKVDYNSGAVIAQFTPEDIVERLPELKKIANIHAILVSNIMSESIRFGHYNIIAKAIEDELKNNPKGIIITHGTDTMHYTAAALSFMLENINIPIILVGSQRSSDRGSSDASMNLLCAAKFIAETNFCGAAICMHASSNDEKCAILPGTKVRKMHTSRRDAFRAVNAKPIAYIDFKNDNIEYPEKKEYKADGKFKVHLFKENIKVGILRTHTNIYPKDIKYFENHKGLIIEGTGLGHAPSVGFDDISKINEENRKAIAELCKKSIVVLTSQCIYGRVNMNIYSPQRQLLEIGVLPGDDMTTETAFIKLAWLLSNYDFKEAKKLFNQNLRGEISERIVYEEEFSE